MPRFYRFDGGAGLDRMPSKRLGLAPQNPTTVATPQRARTLLSNHAPIFGWGFMTVWMTSLTGMTYVFLRDGGIPDMPYPLGFAVLVLFWFFGVLASTYFFAIPRTTVRADGTELMVCEHWLIGTRTERLPTIDAADLFVTQEEDSDGAAHFVCVLVTPSARHVKLHESHSRHLAEQAHGRLLAAAREMRQRAPGAGVCPID
jgi:hypothetical protein